MKLIVHAPNVHQGGGKSLLLPLLHAALKQTPVKALLDRRLEVPDELHRAMTITQIAPTLFGRLAGEWELRQSVAASDIVLCFGNLPPLFRNAGRSIVFLQNRYLVEDCALDGFPLRVKLRLMVERLWLRLRSNHVNTFLVQTKSMQQAAAHALRRQVEIVALFPGSSGYARRRRDVGRGRSTRYDFLYVATSEPHKNHLNLIESWKLLASEGFYPSLCLTVSETDSPHLCKIIEDARAAFKLNIATVPASSWSEIERLYNHSRALVYPSMVESFGLPLIEARQAGLAIIAAELDYVRDLVDPEESFDPQSPQSIARAIKRFLGAQEPIPMILTSEAFVTRLLES